MNTLYQKVPRYTFPCTYLYMYICIYLTCTRNLFRLEPLPGWVQMQATGYVFQVWQRTARLGTA